MRVVKVVLNDSTELSDILVEEDPFYGGIFIAQEHIDAWRKEFDTERKAEDSLVEEMAELIQAINKQRRSNTKQNKDAIREEMAHVLISLKGLCRYKMITPGEIEKEIQAKWPAAYEPKKGDKSDSNTGNFDITNEKALELMVKVSDTKHEYNKKWQAMLNVLKAKGVEVLYMGEQDGKPIIDVKIPEIDILRKDGVLKGQQCLKLKEDLDDLKKELEALKSRTLDNVEIRLSCGDIVWTYCDGFVHVSSKIDGIISADQIATGTVPKCSSCSHFMHNPSRFAHDWCYKPLSKEGPGTIRKLSKEEVEGPACSDFKARKE